MGSLVIGHINLNQKSIFYAAEMIYGRFFTVMTTSGTLESLVHFGVHVIVPHLIGPPSHWSPISLVPLLISPPSHWSPNYHPSTNHSFGPPSHCPPWVIGPPSHWSPISLVAFSLVPQSISPPLHCLDSSVPLLIGPPFSLVPHYWSIPMVPHLIGPPM